MHLYPRIEVVLLKLKEISNLREIAGVKALSGSPGFYRLRIGDYRLGFKLVAETIVLLRADHRREIYRHFP